MTPGPGTPSPVISVPRELLPDSESTASSVGGVHGYGSLADISLASTRFYVPPYMGGPEGFQIMARMPALEVVQLPTAGFDHALAHVPAGVILCNAGGVHDASTAELAVGLVIARLRRIDEMARAMPHGDWIAGRYDALADRRVLIIGFGGVGRAIAARLTPFEVEVIPVARTAREGVHALGELPDLLPTADVVILAVPLDDATRGMVDAAFLARMRDGALLVNVARGSVVLTDDLLAEVSTGRLQAVLDVTDPEPLPAEHALWRTPGVLISPHVGGNSTAFAPRMRRLITEQVRRWRVGEQLRHIVS
jgi:phosphoglycerate dehydrogenase-like enzyme